MEFCALTYRALRTLVSDKRYFVCDDNHKDIALDTYGIQFPPSSEHHAAFTEADDRFLLLVVTLGDEFPANANKDIPTACIKKHVQPDQTVPGIKKGDPNANGVNNKISDDMLAEMKKCYAYIKAWEMALEERLTRENPDEVGSWLLKDRAKEKLDAIMDRLVNLINSGQSVQASMVVITEYLINEEAVWSSASSLFLDLDNIDGDTSIAPLPMKERFLERPILANAKHSTEQETKRARVEPINEAEQRILDDLTLSRLTDPFSNFIKLVSGKVGWTMLKCFLRIPEDLPLITKAEYEIYKNALQPSLTFGLASTDFWMRRISRKTLGREITLDEIISRTTRPSYLPIRMACVNLCGQFTHQAIIGNPLKGHSTKPVIELGQHDMVQCISHLRLVVGELRG